MYVVLVQPPFFRVDQPSLSLSLLKSALEQAGHDCEIVYFNIAFAADIGMKIYSDISDGVFCLDFMLGDLIFAEALWDRRLDLGVLEAIAEKLPLESATTFPGWFVQSYGEISRRAAEHTRTVAEQISRSDCQLVGISSMFHLTPALALARMIKSSKGRGSPPVILGGSSCQSDMGVAIHRAFPWIDFVAEGEGEKLIVELAGYLSDDVTKVDTISGLVWRNHDGKSIANRLEAVGPVPMDDLPWPLYDDWMAEVQVHFPELREGNKLILPFETSRGCWYGEKVHCIFCGLNGEQIAYRRKSIERALAEFRGLLRYDIPSIAFVDNILDFKSFDTLLPELAKLEHGRTIFCEVKANIREQEIRFLRDAGITHIQPGIESLNTPVLKIMRKGVTAFQNIRLLKLASQYRLTVKWNIIYGFPGESTEDYHAMAELIPALVHLQPPFNGGARVRIARFSPLFAELTKLGVEGLYAHPFYEHILHVDQDLIEQIAFYFYSRALKEVEKDYLMPFMAAIRQWRSLSGNVVFISLERNRKVYLFDTRPIATIPNAVLEDTEAAVFIAAKPGCTRQQMIQVTGLAPEVLDPIVERFLWRRWMVDIDDHLLALAVPMDEYVPQNIPEVILGPACFALLLTSYRDPNRTDGPNDCEAPTQLES